MTPSIRPKPGVSADPKAFAHAPSKPASGLLGNEPCGSELHAETLAARAIAVEAARIMRAPNPIDRVLASLASKGDGAADRSDNAAPRATEEQRLLERHLHAQLSEKKCDEHSCTTRPDADHGDHHRLLGRGDLGRLI